MRRILENVSLSALRAKRIPELSGEVREVEMDNGQD